MVIYFASLRFDFDEVFKPIFLLSVLTIPVYIIYTLFWYNPVNLVLANSWTSWMSPLQYLIFIPLVAWMNREHGYIFSVCLAWICAAVSGYLYEVPRWLIRDGFYGVFRTARYSFLVLDFGMLAVPFMFYMLRDRRIKVNLLLVLSGLVYMVYVVFYGSLVGFYIHSVYPLVGVPTTVLCRVPAMWVIYQLVTTECCNKHLL